MIKTYYVGRLAGSVKRLDDFTLPWVDVSVVGGDIYNDVMTIPNDPEKVTVIGKKSDIRTSIDSGATWNIPGGNFQSFGGVNNEFFEVWIVDQNTSYVVAKEGVVVKSVDGGATYNGTTTFPTLSGVAEPDFLAEAVHFIDANIGVVATSNVSGGVYLWKTVDGGTTWVGLNSGNLVIPKGHARGIHLSADQSTITVTGTASVQRSTDAGVTFGQVLDLSNLIPAGAGSHMTWISDDELWVSGFFDQLWKSVDAGATWNVIRPYDGTAASIIGAHFYDSDNGYLGGGEENDIYTTDDAGINTVLSENFSVVHAIWTEFGAFTPCYTLTDCAGIASPIYTAEDLADHIGQVVTLSEDGQEVEGCWLVSENITPCVNPTEIVIYQCFTQCSDCLPAEPPVPTPKPRAVRPEFNTGLCDPKVVEKAFCEFGEMIYKRMMQQRFKIENCCPQDDENILIQYEKVKLLLLESQDPTPDECNPLCYAYEATVQPTFSAVTTFVDCFGTEQTIVTPTGTEPQVISFCALNTTTPTITITDSSDNEIGTFPVTPIEECLDPVSDTCCINVTMYNGPGFGVATLTTPSGTFGNGQPYWQFELNNPAPPLGNGLPAGIFIELSQVNGIGDWILYSIPSIPSIPNSGTPLLSTSVIPTIVNCPADIPLGSWNILNPGFNDAETNPC
jgi:photosystem II stability/assembly factor-like uncharacterized protein